MSKLVTSCPTQDISKIVDVSDDKVREIIESISCLKMPPEYTIIILEKLENFDSIDKMAKSLNDEQLKKILFQLLYTVECFVRIGVRHNDLQYENILLVKLKTPKTTEYTVDNKKFYLTYEYDPVIFDFDKSNKYSNPVINTDTTVTIGDNPINLCSATGIFNGYNTIYDTLRVMCLYEKNIKQGWLEKNLKSIYPLMKPAIQLSVSTNPNTCFFPKYGFTRTNSVISYFPESYQLLNLYFNEFTKVIIPVSDSYKLPERHNDKFDDKSFYQQIMTTYKDDN